MYTHFLLLAMKIPTFLGLLTSTKLVSLQAFAKGGFKYIRLAYDTVGTSSVAILQLPTATEQFDKFLTNNASTKCHLAVY